MIRWSNFITGQWIIDWVIPNTEGEEMNSTTGKKFESLIKLSANEQGFDHNRMKDAGWQGEQTQRRFTIKNICDLTLFKSPSLFYIEAKSSKKSLPFKRLNQHKALLKKHGEGIANVHAGYLLEIAGLYFYVPVFDMGKIMIRIGKKSVNANDLAGYGINTTLPKGKKKPRLDLGYLPVHGGGMSDEAYIFRL